MGGDYTRLTFQPRRDYDRVRMQQGRVQLDADWNEQVDAVDRRLRAQTLDLVGRAVVPAETPDGFRICLGDDGVLTIGRGRLYLDGLLVENRGAGERRYDRHLGEVVHHGSTPFDDQPYAFDVTLPGSPDNGIFYLEAWEREVTAIQDPDLVEPALGVDTATRVQVVWQVRFLSTGDETPRPGDVVDCRDWRHLVRPPAGRLSTTASDAYAGAENRLYRVEIHDSAARDGTGATFKWSTDNGSSAYGIHDIGAGGAVTIRGAPGAASFPFHRDDWVELVDDRGELSGCPGVMARIASVDASHGQVTLAADPPDWKGFTAGAGRHPRIRRWNGGGAIAVPDTDRPVALGDGVRVSFTTEGGGAGYRTGDHWLFAARSAGGTVEQLCRERPRGILRHRCPLALADDYPCQPHDVRTIWYPRTETRAHDESRIEVVVDADGHAGRRLTVQEALDRVRRGGGVRLGPGVYWLEAPLSLREARSLRLSGVGPATVLAYCGDEAAVVVGGSRSVTVEDLAIVVVGARSREPAGLRDLLSSGLAESRDEAWQQLAETGGGERTRVSAIDVCDSGDVTLRRCELYQVAARGHGSPAVALRGELARIGVLDCVIHGVVGIGSAGECRIEGLRIERNELACDHAGVHLDERGVHGGHTIIGANSVRRCGEVGIAVLGFLHPEPHAARSARRLAVVENGVRVPGAGIAVVADRARIAANDVIFSGEDAAGIEVHLAPAAEVDVVDNVVHTGGAGRALRTEPVGDPRWQQFLGLWERLFGRSQGRGAARPVRRLSVRGNLLEAGGGAHAAEVRVHGPCVVAANQFAGRGAPVVSIHASAAVVEGNHVEGPADETAMIVECRDRGPACVQGNVVSGPVEVRGRGCPDQGRPQGEGP